MDGEAQIMKVRFSILLGSKSLPRETENLVMLPIYICYEFTALQLDLFLLGCIRSIHSKPTMRRILFILKVIYLSDV